MYQNNFWSLIYFSDYSKFVKCCSNIREM